MPRKPKNSDERVAGLELKKAQLQAQIDDILAAKAEEERARDDQQKYIWGGMCKALFRTDPEFKEMMWQRADENITRKYDRKVLGLPERDNKAPASPVEAVRDAMTDATNRDG